MPIPSKTRYPLESFDPRLRDIWLTAIRQPVEIEFESSKLAIAFQNRLQQYRAALKRERPEDARLFYRAKCSRSGNRLRVSRQDEEFESVFSQLDSKLLVKTLDAPLSEEPAPPAPRGPSETPIPLSTPEPSALEFSDLFADIPVTYISEDDKE